eukprot:5431700-Pyramimonas_sp.AAC.1
MSGAASHIDFACIPQEAQGSVRWTCTWTRAGEAIRAINIMFDHIPVAMEFQRVAPVNTRPLRERWDRRRLACAVLAGAGREEFLEGVRNALLGIPPPRTFSNPDRRRTGAQ